MKSYNKIFILILINSHLYFILFNIAYFSLTKIQLYVTCQIN